jgi:hypothetical protein
MHTRILALVSIIFCAGLVIDLSCITMCVS